MTFWLVEDRQQDAIAHNQRAIDTFRDTGDGGNQAATLSRLGDAYAALSNGTAARAAWSSALTVLQELNHPDTRDLQERLEKLTLPG